MSARHFIIYPEPTIWDPANLIQVVEVVQPEGEAKQVNYSSTKVLRDLLDDMDVRAIQRAQDVKTRMEVLAILGISTGEFIARVRAQREKQK